MQPAISIKYDWIRAIRIAFGAHPPEVRDDNAYDPEPLVSIYARAAL